MRYWILAISICWVGAFAGDQSEAFKRVDQKQAVLKKQAKRLEQLLDAHLEYEKGILHRRIRKMAPLWREDRIPDDEMEEYQRLYTKALALHAMERLDYSATHRLFQILKKRVQSLDIVFRGKVQYEQSRAGWAEFEKGEIMHRLMCAYLMALTQPPPKAYQEMRGFAGVVDAIGESNRQMILDQERRLALQEQQFIWGLIPIVGDAMEAAAVYQGTDIWGAKLSWMDRGLGLLSAFGILGDAGDLLDVVKKMNGLQRATLGRMSKLCKSMKASEITMIDKLYGPNARKTLALFGSCFDDAGNVRKADQVPELLERSRLLQNQGRKAPVLSTEQMAKADKARKQNERMMSAARDALQEQEVSRKAIAAMKPGDRVHATVKAWGVVNEHAAAVDLGRLMNPSKLRPDEYKALKKSFGWSEAKLDRIKRDPKLLYAEIEKFTGRSIDELGIMGRTVRKDDYMIMRPSNAGALRLSAKEISDTWKGVVYKPLAIKAKSGVAGLIPVNQRYNKRMADLAEARKAGNAAQVAKIQGEMDAAGDSLRKLINDANQPQYQKSGKLEGHDLVLAKVNGEQTIVQKTADGRILNPESGKALSDAEIIKNKNGKPELVEILVDQEGRPYVPDGDPLMMATKRSDGIVQADGVTGVVSSAGEQMRGEMAVAFKREGKASPIVHGDQRRAFAMNLDVDSKLYTIENGRIRFIREPGGKGKKVLSNFIHAHRLRGNNAAINPEWFRAYDPMKGFTE